MGVSRQTVSNYISRGILKAFGSHNYPMVDKAAIDKIFDSINDVEASRMELAKMKEEINRDCEDTRKPKHYGYGIPTSKTFPFPSAPLTD